MRSKGPEFDAAKVGKSTRGAVTVSSAAASNGSGRRGQTANGNGRPAPVYRPPGADRTGSLGTLRKGRLNSRINTGARTNSCGSSEIFAPLPTPSRISCNASSKVTRCRRRPRRATLPAPARSIRPVLKLIPLPHVRWCIPLARLTQVDACGCKVMGMPPCCCQFSKFSTFLHTL